MRLHATHKPGFEYWRGQRYEDGVRVIEVVALRGKRLGIMCKLKDKPDSMVRFSVSKEGAAVLARQLQQVLQGKLKLWKTPLEMVWAIAPMSDTGSDAAEQPDKEVK